MSRWLWRETQLYYIPTEPFIFLSQDTEVLTLSQPLNHQTKQCRLF